MINLEPQNLRWLRVVPGASWRKIPPEWWIVKQRTYRRCHYCHPSVFPPFPDCPHGHYLTPRRLEEQIRYNWRSDFIWYTGVALLCSIFLAGGLVIFLINLAAWLFFFLAFLYNHHVMRGCARRLYRTGVAYDDYESYLWEPRKRRNEPWNRQYYP